MKRLFAAFALLVVVSVTVMSEERYPINYVAATLVQLNDNGAWSWFMDTASATSRTNKRTGSASTQARIRPAC